MYHNVHAYNVLPLWQWSHVTGVSAPPLPSVMSACIHIMPWKLLFWEQFLETSKFIVGSSFSVLRNEDSHWTDCWGAMGVIVELVYFRQVRKDSAISLTKWAALDREYAVKWNPVQPTEWALNCGSFIYAGHTFKVSLVLEVKSRPWWCHYQTRVKKLCKKLLLLLLWIHDMRILLVAHAYMHAY